MSPLEGCVRWRGQSAVYTSAERLIMADLPVREQAFVHALKAFTHGEIGEAEHPGPGSPVTAGRSPEARDESFPASPTVYGIQDGVPDGRTCFRASETLGTGEMVPVGASSAQRKPGVTSPVLFVDPEEIEFGKPKRRPRVYALVCTWKQSCVVPTKREGEFWMKVWKAWYERQGWKVKTHDTGYFAAKGEERHSIGLDEYDRETKERIK